MGFAVVFVFGPFECETAFPTSFEDLLCLGYFLAAILYFVAFAFLGFHVVKAWAGNEQPPVAERIATGLVFLFFPYGFLVWYWLIYRRLDVDGQFSLWKTVSSSRGQANLD